MIRQFLNAAFFSVLTFLSHCTLAQSASAPSNINGRFLFQTTDEGWWVSEHGNPKAVPIVFRSDEVLHPGAVRWMHRGEGFVGSVMHHSGRKFLYSDVDEFDRSGKLMRSLYRTDSSQFVADPYLSWDDTKMVFITYKLPKQELRSMGRMPEGTTRSITIIDTNSGKIIDSVRNSGNVFWFQDSPWIIGDSKFVYTTIADTLITGKPKTVMPLFIYDLEIRESRKIDADIGHAAASPTSQTIAYTLKNQLWLFDLATGDKRLLFTAKDEILELRWNPDGSTILVKNLNVLRQNESLLINVADGSQQVVNFSFSNFFWK